MLIYTVSYLTRINFGTIIVEIVSDTGYSKEQLSWALTGSFMTYGLGQLISGWLGDRFQPKKLVLAGLIVSVSMNIFVPFAVNPYIMTVLWCINGLAQAFMWPPIVKIMTNILTQEQYNRTSVVVSYGSAGGTILIYLLAPVIISFAGWKGVFFFSAVCGIIMIVIWGKLCPVFIIAKHESKRTAGGMQRVLLSPMMITVMLAIIFQGALRDGVTTWMPSYITETYKLGNGTAILTGVFIPVFTLICLNASERIYEHFFKSPIACSGAIFSCGAIAAIALLVFPNKNPIISVLLSALLTGCMHGVNFMLISILPSFFKSNGCVSFISGILNSCTYVGSAVSTYGIAVLTDSKGWVFTIGAWCLIAIIGTLLCFISVPLWEKFKQN